MPHPVSSLDRATPEMHRLPLAVPTFDCLGSYRERATVARVLIASSRSTSKVCFCRCSMLSQSALMPMVDWFHGGEGWKVPDRARFHGAILQGDFWRASRLCDRLNANTHRTRRGASRPSAIVP